MRKCHAKQKEMLGIQLITTINIKDILYHLIISVLTGIFTTQPILRASYIQQQKLIPMLLVSLYRAYLFRAAVLFSF